MTRKEHLLIILSEECNEIAQRISKALRFGLSEIQPGQKLTNEERIRLEFADLLAVVEMLQYDEGVLDKLVLRSEMDSKKEKVNRFLEYSRECGTLTEELKPLDGYSKKSHDVR
jgi:NTP pyrophosphatase (non-canonical NTP hydrolase)